MEHYTEQTVDFLWRLRLNNSREWFREHKEEYERLMLAPTKALANALYDHFSEVCPKHTWGLHLSRIYRDARRLYGRGPMNDHLWFAIFADGKRDGAPAFYFGFEPEGYDYGMGCWHGGNVMMARFRRQIAIRPEPAEQLARRFARQDTFALYGEPYKKPKMQTSSVLQDWANRRELGFHCEKPHDEISLGPALYETLRQGFDFLIPYFEYLTTLPELEEYDQ